MSAAPGHNHYRFLSTTIDCTDVPGDSEAWGGLYDVDANGGTDGPDHPLSDPPPDTPNGDVDHGEDCELGWSHSSLYSGGETAANANKGDIGVTHRHAPTNDVSPIDTVINGNRNWVKFVRRGSVVEAWGELTFTAAAHGGGAVRFFYATLQFTPDVPQTCATTPVSDATLNGTATIWGA